MNYIGLLKQLWQCNNEVSMGCSAISLYIYLLEVCNSLGWKKTFRHSDRFISVQLGVSVNTVRTAKNKLKQLGLIDFKRPEKASRGLEGSTCYTLLTRSNSDRVSGMVTDTVSNAVIDSVSDTRNKLNYITIEVKGEDRLVFESLMPLMDELLNDEVIIEDLERSKDFLNKSSEAIQDLIKEFFVKLTVDGESVKNRKDAIYHLKSWHKKNIQSSRHSRYRKKYVSDEDAPRTFEEAGYKLIL